MPTIQQLVRNGRTNIKNKSKSPAARGTGKTSSGRAAVARASDFDRAMEGKDLSRAKRYKPAITFAPGEVIDHPSFRFGVVTRLLSDSKIEVVFEVGPKTLVHAREGSAA